MIDFIRGIVVYHETEYVAVDVAGIGYQIMVTHPITYEEQEEVFLYTHYVVREDAHLLYGFRTKDERDLFRLLLEVSGIGPKAGLAILAGGTPQQIVSAIQLENLKFLTALPGIGKKTAQRIVLDLKDKLQKLGWDRRFKITLQSADIVQEAPKSQSNDDPAMLEVIDALIGLGYHDEEARSAVTKAKESVEGRTLSTEEWIRIALQASIKG